MKKSVTSEKPPEGVWFVYDGACPLCTQAAYAFRIKEAVGELYLVDARQEGQHQKIINEINSRGLDLDEGMVIKYGEQFYHGDEALHLMALIGSSQGWFNRVNAVLFKNKAASWIAYPLMRAGRNFFLFIRGVKRIRNLNNDQ